MSSPRKGALSHMWWLCASALVYQMVHNAVRPLLSLHLSQQGASIGSVALVTSFYGAAALLVGYPAGLWIDRVGSRPVIRLGYLVMALGTVAVPFAGTDIIWYAVIQSLIGIGGIITLLAQQAGVAAISSAANRDRAFTGYSVWTSAGQMLGPIVGGASFDLMGWSSTFWMLALLTAIGIFAPVGTTNSSQQAGPGATGSAVGLLREPRVRSAMLAGVLVISTIDTITTFFPVYGQAIGLSATAIGLILGMRGAASMLVRPLQVFAVRRLTRQGALIWVLATSAVATCLIGLTANFTLLLVAACMTGMCLGLGQPISITEIVDATPELWRGRALGMRLVGNRIVQLFSPLLFGAMANLGLSAVFVGSGALLALGAAVTAPTGRSWRGGRISPPVE